MRRWKYWKESAVLYVIEDAAGRYERYVTSREKADEYLVYFAAIMNVGEEIYVTLHELDGDIFYETTMETYRVDESHKITYFPNE
jgi:hypothetical protein